MKKIFLLLGLLIGFQGFSQEEFSFSSLEKKELKNNIRLNYILIDQPVDKVTYPLDPKMGFIGLNYNIPLNDWLYTGAGFHTAITGDQGGLFTLGVNLGIKYSNL